MSGIKTRSLAWKVGTLSDSIVIELGEPNDEGWNRLTFNVDTARELARQILTQAARMAPAKVEHSKDPHPAKEST